MQHDRFAAVGPNADGCSFGVTVALELFKAIRTLRFLALHDDEGGVRGVLVGNHNVGGLLMNGGAELNGFFKKDTFRRVTVIIHEHLGVELPDDFFRFCGALLPGDKAFQIGFASLHKEYKFFRRARFEHGQRVGGLAQNVIYGRRDVLLSLFLLDIHLGLFSVMWRFNFIHS